MTLYRKYRPSDFNTFFGNTSILRAIANAIERGKLSHAYLFSGSRGTGKTSLARLIAKSINCESRDKHNPCLHCHICESVAKSTFPDMIEIDAASNRGIEEIRSIKESVFYKPVIGKYKVYIIDEVHMLTKEAFNALLKTLEEPPKHVIFILATTEPEKLPETIHSRCQRYDMQLLSKDEFILAISSIVKQEAREMEDSVYDVVYKESSGSMRDALSLLEKILISIDGKVTLEESSKVLSLVPKGMLEEFYEAFLVADIDVIIKIVDNAWMQGYKLEAFFKDFCLFLKEKRRNPFALIDKIYSTLNEFKFEDNKRVVSYLVVNRLLQLEQDMKDRLSESKIVEKPVERVIQKNLTEKTNQSINQDTKESNNEKNIKEVGVALNQDKREVKDILNFESIKIQEAAKESKVGVREESLSKESKEYKAARVEEIQKVKKEIQVQEANKELTVESRVEEALVERASAEESLVEGTSVQEIKASKVEKEIRETVEETLGNRVEEVGLENIKSKEEVIEQAKLEENKKVSDFIKISLNQVEASWSKVLELAKAKKLSLMIFLTAAKLVKVEKNLLEISYDTVFHKESLEKIENKIILQGILYDIFNTKFEIKVSLSTSLNKLDLFLQEEVR